MSLLPAIAIAAAVAWAVLAVVAQAMTPEQSVLCMGMSGLVHGRARWLMKAAFVLRGLAALALVAALPASLPGGALTIAGLALFWLWGAGSALLALVDTDMPGEKPTRQGEAHAVIAMVAYVAGVAGMVLLSFVVRGDAATADVARWALPIALVAVVAVIAQFAAFGAAARAARGPAAPGLAAPSGPSAPVAPAAIALAAPPQLAGTGAPAPSAPPARGLGLYAGLLQRVFLVLVMVWTVVVAAGL
jgi:hypothetical protein